MKKIMNKVNMAIIAAMVSSPAMAAGVNPSGICALIGQMRGVFEILRTLAFVGAAFTIAGWAWTYISKGEVKKDDLKDKGVGMMVGFILLFGVGIVLQFLLSTSGGRALGCPEILGW